MLDFKILDPRVTPEHLGFIPCFLIDHDPRPASVQIDERYAHGGGWRAMSGFRAVGAVTDTCAPILRYPGDPPFQAYAMATLHRDEQHPDGPAEVFVIYECAICAIFRAGELHSPARLD